MRSLGKVEWQLNGGKTMEEINHLLLDGHLSEKDEHEDLLEEEMTGPDLSRSFCANSDLFAHGLFVAPRDLPDEVYRRQADFFHTRPFRNN